MQSRKRMFLELAAVAALAASPMITGCGGGGGNSTGNVSQAASVHLKGGANAEPAFTDEGSFLRAVGSLSGLGGGDILISLTATGNATADCVNPGTGEHRPPGQNPAPVTVAGNQPISEDEIKNGNVSFNVTTAAPVSPIPGAPGCPNKQWTENITGVAFTAATITVEQPVGTLVLTVSCTFSASTSNGTVPGSQVTCTSISP